jgi:Zn-dependent protease/CBS domain-containing protein
MRVGRLFGIDLYINVSWLFIFALVAWSLGSDFGPLRGLAIAAQTRAVLGVIAALLLFTSVIAHEFAHALVSRAYGLRVSRITLYLFGGVAQLDSPTPGPTAEALVTAAGPLTSLAIAGVAYPIGLALGPTTAAGAIASYLSWANLVLAVFNLVPAIPLDGGRILHALAWAITKDSMRATDIAARVSRFFAAAIIAVGIALTVGVGFGTGLWLVLIGWFIWQAGESERSSVHMENALRGLKAIDLAAVQGDPIPADATTKTALDRLVKSGRNVAPVTLGDRLLGIVSLSDLLRTGPADPDSIPVTAIMTRTADLKSVSPAAPAIDVVRMLGENGFRQVPLIDESGSLVGFVTREGVLAHLTRRA